MLIIFLLFIRRPIIGDKSGGSALNVSRIFKRRFITYTYSITLLWVLVLSAYYHQVIHEATAIRSVESAIVILIPLAYMGALLVIPQFSILMLLCLVIHRFLDHRSIFC